MRIAAHLAFILSFRSVMWGFFRRWCMKWHKVVIDYGNYLWWLSKPLIFVLPCNRSRWRLESSESQNVLPRGEAEVSLLDECGQVFEACSLQLFQNLDLEKLLSRFLLVGNMQKRSRYVSSQSINSCLFSAPEVCGIPCMSTHLFYFRKLSRSQCKSSWFLYVNKVWSLNQIYLRWSYFEGELFCYGCYGYI